MSQQEHGRLLEKECDDMIKDILTGLETEWVFTKRTRSGGLSFSCFPKEDAIWVFISLNSGTFTYQVRIPPSREFYIPATRSECIKLAKRQVIQSNAYQTMLVKKQLEDMNSHMKALVKLMTDGVELSPDNSQKMQELKEHFSELSGTKN